MTRKLLLLILFTLPRLLGAQERYIEFVAQERPEDAEYDSISWLGSDKIHQEFTLKGNDPAKCRLTIAAKGETLLEQSLHNKWQVIDTLSYIVFPTDEGYLTPQFTITDFNQDGLEDFMFLPMTNMHGAMGYYIYLQDTNGVVIPLKNHAFSDEDENAWPDATYDAATHTIDCEMPGGAFGSWWKATYRLDGYVASPLEMHYETNNMQTQFDQHFRGNGNKWELDRQQSYIALGMGYENYDTMDVLHYRLDQDENRISKLYCTDGEENAVYQESMDIPGFVDERSADNYFDHIPCFLITDFNQDGNHDLVLYTGLDVHGSSTAYIFLGDRKSKKLVKLHNTAEGTDVWDTPEYDPKTNMITCNRISGNAGLSFTSIYKLKGFTAQPVAKEVRDFTNVNGETGKGYSESIYKGKKGKWMLKETVKDE